MKLNNFDTDVYEIIQKLLVEDARSVTIKTREGTIIFEMKRCVMVGTIYKDGSLDSVWMHSQNSYLELVAVFESLGVCIYDVIKQLVTGLLWKRNKPLLIELNPSTK